MILALYQDTWKIQATSPGFEASAMAMQCPHTSEFDWVVTKSHEVYSWIGIVGAYLVLRTFLRRECLAYGTRARSARGSQNRAILSIICPFTGNSAFRLCVSIYPVERKRFLFAKLNTLSIRFCRLLTLDSKIPAWIRLRLVRKSTTAYVRILLADNPSLLTKKLPQNVLNGFLALY